MALNTPVHLRLRTAICFGGSVTAGVRTLRGYPEHLWELLQEDHLAIMVLNRGIAGACAVDVLRALPLDVPGYLPVPVVLVGTYDARGGGPPPREYRAILRQLITQVVILNEGLPVILCTPPPMIGSTIKGFNRPARRWIHKAVDEAEALAIAMPEVVKLVPLHDMDTDLLADGVHPKPAGYRWIAERVAEVIRELP